ncbi:MAG: helix-turn-helix transcriptional regulator [Devosia sp.]|nr:helix-turn-helix transcriptional regulator [Devosia sp.]
MDVRRTIGANVRRYRLALDLSQEAVAERMGVDRAYVSALEVGRRNPCRPKATFQPLRNGLDARYVELPATDERLSVLPHGAS